MNIEIARPHTYMIVWLIADFQMSKLLKNVKKIIVNMTILIVQKPFLKKFDPWEKKISMDLC